MREIENRGFTHFCQRKMVKNSLVFTITLVAMWKILYCGFFIDISYLEVNNFEL